MSRNFSRRLTSTSAVLFVSIVALSLAPSPTHAVDSGPFQSLLGRWTGEGRLGFSEGKVENITCRATYFANENGQKLTQNLRCASAGAKIEVKSEVDHAAGKLSGSWNELIYNKSGQLDGDITKSGYKIRVKGDALNANMEIIVRGDKQIIEIQFSNETLIGLTMVMNKG
jgi:hypothetical protein